MRPLIIMLLSALMWPLSVEATSYADPDYADPEQREILSPNGDVLLVVDPETYKHIISAASDPGTAIWSFNCGVWHSPVLLSNDGQTVAVLAWRHIQEDSLADGSCVTFFAADGSEVRIPFQDVYPNPPKTSQVSSRPIGGGWRTWYHDVEQDGDTFTIVTAGGGSATLGISKRVLVAKRWIGWRKPMNLLIAAGIVAFIGVPAWLFKRRSRKRAEQAGADQSATALESRAE